MNRSFFPFLLQRAGPSSMVKSSINNKTVQPGDVIKTIKAYNFSTWNQGRNGVQDNGLFSCALNSKKDFLQPNTLYQEQLRTKTFINCSWKNGEKETDMDVIDRFYRLNSGNWIRTMAKRNVRVYKKSGTRKAKSLKHVFCNETQCRLLDKMVTKYWKEPKYFIKDPYAPYEWRENFDECRRKPWRPHDCDYE